MSLIPIGVTVAIAAAEDLLSSIFGPTLNIGGIVADVTVQEKHVDELEITDNPVEQNADITDHAYKRPVECTIRVGFSNSSLNAEGDPNYVIEMYQQFLALQASRQPFDIVTTKRLYSNMLAKRVETVSDKNFTNATIIEVACREVILVYTETTSVPPAGNQANPQLNTPPSSTGAATLQPAPAFNFASAPFATAGVTP
jgi:hypothetical protein